MERMRAGCIPANKKKGPFTYGPGMCNPRLDMEDSKLFLVGKGVGPRLLDPWIKSCGVEPGKKPTVQPVAVCHKVGDDEDPTVAVPPKPITATPCTLRRP